MRGFHFSLATSVIVLLANSQLSAQQPDVILNEAGRRIMLASPQPEYPPEARAKHITGSVCMMFGCALKPVSSLTSTSCEALARNSWTMLP
jgi:hypothetical protein